MKKQNSLFYKVFRNTFIVLFIVCFLIFGAIIVLFPVAYAKVAANEAKVISQQLVFDLNQAADEEEVELLIERYQAHHQVSIVIEDQNNQLLINSSNLDQVKFDSLLSTSSNKVISGITENERAHNYLVTVSPLEVNSKSYQLYLLSNIPESSNLISPLLTMLPLITIIILFQSVLIAYINSQVTIKPIEILSKKANAITNLNFDNHYIWNSRDEFGSLSNDLDEMQFKMKQVISHLEDDSYLQNQLALEEQKERIAILSHELNTPLTVLKMQSELLSQDETDPLKKMYLKRSISKVDEIAKLVDQVLKYKEWEDVTSIDLGTFVNETIATNYQNETIEVVINSQVIVVMSELYLSRLITNLISNAIKYNYQNGPIKVTISNNSILVENNHHPQLDFNKERLLKPYVRASATSSTRGQGLGLYICKRICNLNEFVFDVSSSDQVFSALIKFKPTAVPKIASEAGNPT